MNTPPETITIDEITILLKAAAARDQRTADPADTLAWWQDLNIAKVRYQDAAIAVTRYYAEIWPREDPRHRFRLTAQRLIEIVIALREHRITAANYIYEPRHPEETGAEYAHRLQTQLTAIADGHAPPTGRPPLTGRALPRLVEGAAPPLPAAVAAVLTKIRHPARTITCPHCRARAGAPCHAGTARPLADHRPHPSRIDAWATAVAPCPECRVPAGTGCQEIGQPYPHGAHRSRVRAAEQAG